MARRAWMVPPSLLPDFLPSNSPVDLFLAANEWRSEQGIPDQGFFRAWPPLPASGQVRAGLVPAEESPGDEFSEGEDLPVVAGEEGSPVEPEASKNSPPLKSRTGSTDFRKPMFVDFSSPLLVFGMSRTVGEPGDQWMTIEERLPGREDLPESHGKRYSTEVVIQMSGRP